MKRWGSQWVALVCLTGIILAGCLAVRGPVGAGETPPSTAAAGIVRDLQRVDDYPLYVARYEGDYGFDRFLKSGERPAFSGDLPAGRRPWACTGFAAQGGEALYGRNFDWYQHPALLLYTDPPEGYASVSMVDLYYLGYDRGTQLTADAPALRRAPYLPFDGMNDQGLAIGMMAVDKAEAPARPGARVLSDLEVIRLLLDYARNVDEALALLQQYTVQFDEVPLHYQLADRSGRAAVVEFVDGEMRVFRSGQAWQVSTNFLFAEGEAHATCWRYDRASAVLQERQGRLLMPEAMDLLQSVSQSGNGSATLWSVVYNMNSGAIHVVMNRNFQKVYSFQHTMQPNE